MTPRKPVKKPTKSTPKKPTQKAPIKPTVPPPPPPVPAPSKAPHRKQRLNAEEIKAIIPNYRQAGANLAQARFAAEYLTNGFDTGAAYRDAVSGKARNPSAMGNTWLKQPAVLECVQSFTIQVLADKRARLEHEIINTLWAQAFYDPKDLMDIEGGPGFKSWDEIPVELRRCVEGIDTKFFGKDANRCTTTIKLVNRNTALDRLSQYIALMRGVQIDNSATTGLSPETELLLHSVFNNAQSAAPLGKFPRKGEVIGAEVVSTNLGGKAK